MTFPERFIAAIPLLKIRQIFVNGGSEILMFHLLDMATSDIIQRMKCILYLSSILQKCFRVNQTTI